MEGIHDTFKGAPWYSKENPPQILIGGAGGIGSWTTFLVARAGFIPIVVDFDNIEPHNMGGQLYGSNQINTPKVTAIEKTIKDFCGSFTTVVAINQKITPESYTHKYCIAAFDNRASRRVMFNKWWSHYSEDPNAIFIDGVLEAEMMQILCIRGGEKDTAEVYSRYHLVDLNLPPGPCTMKQTSHAAAMIASHIVGFLTNHITNVKEGDEVREVPFYWKYFIPINMITTHTWQQQLEENSHLTS